jgi:hypothetical protein
MRASRSKVAALVENLEGLAVREAVDLGADAASAARVTASQAVHVVAWADAAKVVDLFFGASDAHGQLVRVAGVQGVFAVPTTGLRGYQSALYTRPLRSWRDTAIFSFDDDDVVEVSVSNPHGRFDFVKGAGGWSASRTERRRDGRLGAPIAWAGFDPARVEDLLRAYRSLGADDFGDDAQRAGAGVGDDAEQTGGIVRIRLGHGGERVLRVGAPTAAAAAKDGAFAGSRWAVDEGGDGSLYAVAPWTADWAVAPATRFELGGR